MTAHRSYCVAGVVGSEIVVAGGYNGSLNLSTVEKYNPISDTWTAVAHLGNPRRLCSFVFEMKFGTLQCSILPKKHLLLYLSRPKRGVFTSADPKPD
eukprot:sb/3479045/